MPRKKLKRFAEISTFENVIENPQDLKGKWNKKFFGNSNPITLELACGKGEYALGLAARFPGRNFIGMDRKGERIWVGAKRAREANLKNVVFARTDIERIDSVFGADEISEIWITFPDPQPRRSKAWKRLTSPDLLNIYRIILKPGGLIHLKTDDDDLYDYTLGTIRQAGFRLYKASPDLYAGHLENEDLVLKTTYESMHLAVGKTIKYILFGR